MLGLFYHHLSDIIYRCVRVFLHSILSISFKSIEIVGAENIPTDGPVIFTGNHANQFVDGLVVLMNTPRKVSKPSIYLSIYLSIDGYDSMNKV
jgi:glycerol-3-phosphate O-acyltransferase/dihydroxyacetone phosphate acyltransferase